MNKIDLITEYLGAAFGIVGAILVSINTDISQYGFICFFISSVLLIALSIRKGLHGLLMMQVLFAFINMFGIYRWML